MPDSLLAQLQTIGLNHTEANVYLYLLQQGVAGPPVIAKGVGVTRSNLHHVLQELVAKELIKKRQKGKRYVYLPANPIAALRILDRKREAMQESLPELELLYKGAANKPTIAFYEGPEEVKQIFEALLYAKNKSAVGFASTKRLFDAMPGDFLKYFIKEIRDRRIFLRDILSPSSAPIADASKASIGIYYDFRFVEGGEKDFPTDILVWDNSVAIILLEPHMLATVIESASLADTYRLQFDIMWKALGRRERGL
ncbi:hypothetical protein HY416_03475 [Candidatus Kaiserbacteria bacterium]|nr:hypothetical protein [Candidatus Kaiserbacteria bacterium]